MKTIVSFLFLLLSLCANAQLTITTPIYTYHFQEQDRWGNVYNNNNRGIGMEYTLSDDWEAQAGYYVNSFKRDSFYAGAAWRPLKYGPFEAGFMGGAMSGYSYIVPVYLAATIKVKMTDNIAVNVIAAPPAGDSSWVAVQLMVKF